MKPRTLLVLLAVVAALGAFIWFYERELPSSEERAELAKKVFRMEEEEIAAIELAWRGRGVRLERVEEADKKKSGEAENDEEDEDEDEDEDEEGEEGGVEEEEFAEERWRIARPRFDGEVVEADASSVARLLETLLALEKARTLEDAEPKAVGLDRPRGRVRLETEEGAKVLAIGAPVPTGSRMVVGLEGETYVVDDAVLADLQRPPADWRAREMFPGERADVQRLLLRGAGGAAPVVLVKQGEEFRLERPFADRADRDFVDGLLSDLTNLRAERFLERGRAGEHGLAPPQGVVEVSFAGGAPPARIELGTTDGEGLTATRVGRQVFVARNDLEEAVAREPRAWRSKLWSGLEVFEADRARFTDGAGTVEVARADTDWKRGKDLISFTAVSDLLFAALGAEADRLLTPDEARAEGLVLDRPALTVVLNGGPPQGETLTLYPPASGGVPAKASGRDVVLLLAADKVQEIRDRLADLREAEPLPPQEQPEGGGS